MKTAGLLACLSLAYAAVFGQMHQHGSMPAGDGNFNPLVVTDGRGGFYVTYVERTNATCNVMIKHSPDGANFATPIRVNDRPGDAVVRNENPPKVAVAPTGEVYVCWANEREKWKGDIHFGRSTDRGLSFSRAITINSDAGGRAAGHAFQSIAVDRSGRIFITWIDERDKKAIDRGAEIWLSTSEDRGKTFSRDRRILSDVCECCRTNIQIDSAGRLFLSYRMVPKAGPMVRDIVVASSTDSGKSFRTTRVSADGWDINACPVSGPALCLDAIDQIHVIWFTGGAGRPGLFYSASSDHGSTYAPRKLLDPNQRMGKHAQAVLRADGRILVAWDDQLESTATFFGVLDPWTGLNRRTLVHAQLSYPTIAANNEVIVIAGLGNQNDFLLVFERVKVEPVRRK